MSIALHVLPSQPAVIPSGLAFRFPPRSPSRPVGSPYFSSTRATVPTPHPSRRAWLPRARSASDSHDLRAQQDPGEIRRLARGPPRVVQADAFHWDHRPRGACELDCVLRSARRAGSQRQPRGDPCQPTVLGRSPSRRQAVPPRGRRGAPGAGCIEWPGRLYAPWWACVGLHPHPAHTVPEAPPDIASGSIDCG